MKDPAKLTPLEVAALGVGEHPVGGGCWLRVRPTGARSWAVRYSRAGRDVRFTIGRADGDKAMTLRVARDRAREILVEAGKGHDPQAEKVAARRRPKIEALTVQQLVEKMLARVKLKPQTKTNYTRVAAKRIYPQLGAVPAAELTRTAIRQWGDRIAKKRPAMANQAFNILSRAFSYGLERDLLQATIFGGLKKPAPEKARDRVLSANELWALRRALTARSKRWPDAVGPVVVRLLLETAARVHMVVGARREEFDLDAIGGAVWTIPAARMKAGREHVVPLTTAAVEIVRARLAATTGAELFPAGTWPARGGILARRGHVKWNRRYVDGLRKRLDRELGAAGLPAAEHWVIHDLRRAFATHARERLGVGLDVVSLVLSHSPREGPRVSYTYMRAPLLAERRAALKAWSEWLAALPDPRAKVVPFKEEAKGR